MSKEIVVITGTSTGVGLSAAALLAKDPSQKYKVYASMRNTAKKDELLKKADGCIDKTLFVIEMDVCSNESVNAAIKHVMEKEGKIDVLVNNAGIGMLGSLEDMDWDAMMNLYDTNLFGTFRTIRAVLPSMKKNKKGRIINISSIVGLLPFPFNSVYSSSKYAMTGMSECLAAQLAHFNIHVSLIEPGPIQTQFLSNAHLPYSPSQPGRPPQDEATKELYEKMFSKIMGMFEKEGMMQTGDDVAEYILKAITDEKPHVHYLTNELYEDRLKKKYVDPTGDECLRDTVERYFA